MDSAGTAGSNGQGILAYSSAEGQRLEPSQTNQRSRSEDGESKVVEGRQLVTEKVTAPRGTVLMCMGMRTIFAGVSVVAGSVRLGQGSQTVKVTFGCHTSPNVRGPDSSPTDSVQRCS